MEIDFDAALMMEAPLEPEVMTGDATLPSLADLTMVKARLAAFDSRLNDLVSRAQVLEVADAETQGLAVQMAAQAKKLNRIIEEARKKFVQPALDYQRAVNNLAKGYQDRLKTVESDLKHKLAAYQQRLELERRKAEEEARRAARELQEKINREAAQAGVEPVQVVSPVILPHPIRVRTEAGAAHQRTEWRFEVVDESQVPREYLMVDLAKIRQAVKAGVREISGVRIFEETVTVIRT